MGSQQKSLLVGIDVGSTTVKIAVLDPDDLQILHSRYERHNAEQAAAVRNLLAEAHELFPENEFIPTFCGSAGQPYAEVTDGFFIQEVVANTLAIKAFYPETRTAVELGGQDAKVIFFDKDETRNQLTASDMRMNGSCAGGTGAFIDQIAELLHIRTEDFNAYAQRGQTVHEISGRCGVFAKTDISPLINQGVSKEDIALSSFHALVKQTIGGLAQGMAFRSKVIFEGGPLTFNTVLVDVFTQRIGLTPDEVIIPERPEIIVACGAALSPRSFHADKPNRYNKDEALRALNDYSNKSSDQSGFSKPFFTDENERRGFSQRHPALEENLPEPRKGKRYPVWIGIDAGSTTAKFVMIDDEENLLDKFYAPNRGEPLDVITQGLKELRDKWIGAGAILDIRGVGTTGYGENLFARAYHADYHCVETVAHARAARKFAPDVSFILDIGGQDMKAISLSEGIVSGIVLNEACSAGCGSFLETYARSLGIPVEDAAQTAFTAENPSHLGSRCTVFMNSAIVTEQKNGSSSGDIIAGICRSIIENVFTKVIRISNFSHLGDKVVVQGGTFKNDAVLRALEQYIERLVVRAPYPGEMGALGVALLCRENSDGSSSSFIGLSALENFSYEKNPGQTCPFCANHCSRTVISFNNGRSYITGNRCERGEVLGDINDEGVREKLKQSKEARDKVPDLLSLPAKLLFADYQVAPLCESKNLKVGIPRTLEFWSSAPFWHTLFRALGYTPVFSDPSSYRIFDKALPFIPSDTVCFPAKLAHGHVESLMEKGVDRIFFPQMIQSPRENKSAERSFYCVILQGYPLVVEKSNETQERNGIPMDTPLFHWTNESLKKKQITEFLEKVYGVKPLLARKAYALAATVLTDCETRIADEGKRALESLGKEDIAVLVACRPYHLDPLVNHGLSRHFTRLGIPVITLDSLETAHTSDLEDSRIDTVVGYHNRMLEAALQVAADSRLELVQIVSFGCGHDAVLSDEITRLLSEKSGKEPLILKLDEGDAAGPLQIRIKSFVETVRERRKLRRLDHVKKIVRQAREVFPVKFTKEDKKNKTIYVPNLSPAFSRCMSAVLSASGYTVKSLPLADKAAIELGKKFVHNDICFPAQINIGEFLGGLADGSINPKSSALGIAKNCESCRARQYPALARKALDDSGYPEIPIITTGNDNKSIHPGFKYTFTQQLNSLWGLTITDALERMRRRIRPYELEKGITERIFEESLTHVCLTVPNSWKKAMGHLEEAVINFNSIAMEDTPRRPRVGVIGEILMNYHPSANGFIENYLEEHGMEVVLPNLHDFFRKGNLVTREMAKRHWTPSPFLDFFSNDLTGRVFDFVNSRVQKKMRDFHLGDTTGTIHNMAENVEGMIDITYRTGEGWKIPGEIIEMEKEGVHSFVIVQPFGCLPNHITGRGFTKTLKKMLPHVQILSLDYDPDVSMANIENRLQMLIINALEKSRNVS